MKLCWFIDFAQILIFLQLCAACFTLANVTTDQTALLALRAHISYDSNNILANNWSTSAPVCSWVGVECDAHHRHRVTKLNLSNMGLRGSIPSQLGNLSFLNFLSIRNNNFDGYLPTDLTRLIRLKFLDLGFNHFSGFIPAYLGSFPKLENLFLDDNEFTGYLPSSSFSNATSLKRLDMSHNYLTGFMLCNLSSLQIFDLSFNNLQGELNVDIFDCLPKLRELYLSDNRISRAIPSSLFKRRNLQILSLSRNNFNGSLPTEIGNFTMLKELYLDHNNFTGKIPEEIGCLTKVLNLSISNNQITGSIPSSFGNCTFLQEINLSENNLRGAIPPVIGDLDSIQILRIHHNDLSGNFPEVLFNISTMKAIVAFANRLTGSLPSTMAPFLRNLMEFRLGGNALDGVIPSSISNASKLAFLDLSDNSFTGFIPSTLGNLRHLQVLNLANNFLTSETSTTESSFITALTKCKQLTKIDLSDNPLNSTLPVSIGNLSSSLQQFFANNCNNQGKIPGEIGNLTNLIGLSLKNNKLTGTIPTTIGRLEKLQVLYLEDNKLQGNLIYGLCRLSNLAGLSLGGNKLSGSIPNCWDNLTYLQSLNLSSNRLNSTIPLTFWTLEDILAINMSSNLISGHIPLDIEYLKVVEEIDFSSNQLTGEIPRSIGSLNSLTHLSLAKNRLQGLIPFEIAISKGLEWLDLSCNNLSGIIPKELVRLVFLEHFNVSVNRLEGEIPIQGPFSKFSAKSYMMNKALCGVPQLLVPPCSSAQPPRVIFLMKLMIPLVVSLLLAWYIFLCLRCRIIRSKLPWRRTAARPSSGPEVLFQTSYDTELSYIQKRRYTYLELQQATDWFSEGNLIGSGHFGLVYKGTLKDGKVVAIKVFNVEEESSLRSFDVECEIVRKIDHVNTVKTICISNSTTFKALVMEHMANGCLEKWLHTHNYHLDILQRLYIMIDTARALRYLHQRGIIHCDIKPSNVLLDEDMVAHLSDFSISKFAGRPFSRQYIRRSKLMCTIGYAAPEYGTDGIVSTSSDVYSFGVLLMETFTGKKPTDDMFGEGMSLKRWVIESLPKNTGEFPLVIQRVIDPSLLHTDEELFDAKRKCLSRIMTLATMCSEESPKQRLKMRVVEDGLVNAWKSLPPLFKKSWSRLQIHYSMYTALANRKKREERSIDEENNDDNSFFPE